MHTPRGREGESARRCAGRPRAKLIRGTHATAQMRIKKSANLKSSEDLARARARNRATKRARADSRSQAEQRRSRRGITRCGQVVASRSRAAALCMIYAIRDGLEEWNCFPIAGK